MEPTNKLRIGVLHPGAMGVSIAASAVHNGHPVYWASAGRSAETRARATEHHIQDLETLENVCAQSDIILSICPPHAAEDVARQVIAANFHGVYVDANAISPMRAQTIGALLSDANIDFVDGGIIGGPAWERGKTWLSLSGKPAAEIANCFTNGPLETQIVGDEIGKASALKMCYAALTKGTTALLCAVLGASEQLDVRTELYQHWTRDNANAAVANEKRAVNVTAKAWRFEGEMREIADTFRSAGLPDGFHLAAAEIYHRLAPLSPTEMVTIADVLEHLNGHALTTQTSGI